MKNNFIVQLIIITIVLVISIGFYVTSVNIDDDEDRTKSIKYGGNNPHKTEYVMSVTLDKIKGNKAYFKEELPEYLPGITSKHSVDMNFYKSSHFKEENKLKIIRVYSEDDKGYPIHIYSFKKSNEKVR